jgi:hypothetical protein
MSSDYKELLAEFNAHSVEFLIVGAHALAAHGHIRATEDLGVWVRPSRENAPRILAALESFGAPLFDLSEDDFVTPGIVFQIGVAPVRIDVLTQLMAVDFAEAWSERVPTSFEGEPVFVLPRELLIRNKKAVGRVQDLADVEWLEENPP